MNTKLSKPEVIGEIKGLFFTAFHKRGLRWTAPSILAFLDDLYRAGSLQTIVVKKWRDGFYELIDGQQRLITLYLILSYIKIHIPRAALKFDMYLEPGLLSKIFPEAADSAAADAKHPLHLLHEALNTIDSWFNDGEEDHLIKAIELYRSITEEVMLIWCEEADTEPGSSSIFSGW